MLIKKNRFLSSQSSIYLILILAFISLYFFFNLCTGYLNDRDRVVDHFQKNILSELQRLEEKAMVIDSVLASSSDDKWPQLERLLKKPDNTLVQIYRQKKLFFWNNTEISNDILFIEFHQSKIILLNNCWYLVVYSEYESYETYLFKKIKTDFSFENNYMRNHVYSEFSTHNNLQLLSSETQSDYIITDSKGDFLVGVNYISSDKLPAQIVTIQFCIFLLAFLFICLWIDSFFYKLTAFTGSANQALGIQLMAYLALRAAVYFFGIPFHLQSSFLFDSTIHLIPPFTSGGDLIVNGMLLLIISIGYYKRLTYSNINENRVLIYLYWIIASSLLWFISFVSFIIISVSIQSLPYDSFIGFQVNSLYSPFIFAGIFLIILSLFFISRAIGRYLMILNGKLVLLIPGQIALGVLFYLLFLSNTFFIVLASLFAIAILVIIYLNQKDYKVSLLKYLFFVVLFSAISSIITNRAIREMKDRHQIETAQLLQTSYDQQLESLFDIYSKDISNDEGFHMLIKGSRYDLENRIEEYISAKYFNGLSFRYDIQVTICEPGKLIELQPEGLVVDCYEYFNQLISLTGRPTNNTGLYLLNSEPESIYYLAKQKLTAEMTDSDLDMFIEFFYTFTSEGPGFPELLADISSKKLDLSGYSYAGYENGFLTYKIGSFPFQTNYRFLEKYKTDEFFTLDNYRHYKVEIEPGQFLVVSRSIEKISISIVSFSSFFIALVVLIVVVFLIIYGKKVRTIFQLSFQTRLQMVFIVTISFIIILIAGITLYYINLNNKNELVKQLRERTSSVLVELSHKLSGETDLNEFDRIELEQLLSKFSLVFFSDINLYNSDGLLIATSRPKIFESGLLSQNINPMAYEELMVKSKLFFVTEENIYQAKYYSSYEPLMLDSDQPAAIINLPYFARQSEVTQSYYVMIFTFVNLFVILGIVGMLIAIALSRIITRPLMVLQKSLAGIRIDKQNEPIRWKSNDEIGRLIAEYNRMIDKLEQSTAMLKQSEREIAWRQVAQQIAHEIKNPLTPMKLNVQYLEKAYREGDPDLGKKLLRITETLIIQIDTLNKVAEIFSDFAKSKLRNFVEVDLSKVIIETMQLFENHPGVNIEFFPSSNNAVFITKASHKDLLRVFTNLIKNSIQSFDVKKKGLIIIELYSETAMHIVKITDNGKGIPDEVMSNIFQPYFTTKSTGTGLGLAIVKNIMTDIGGKIGFQSEGNNGTTFTLSFPIAAKEDGTSN